MAPLLSVALSHTVGSSFEDKLGEALGYDIRNMNAVL